MILDEHPFAFEARGCSFKILKFTDIDEPPFPSDIWPAIPTEAGPMRL